MEDNIWIPSYEELRCLVDLYVEGITLSPKCCIITAYVSKGDLKDTLRNTWKFV